HSRAARASSCSSTSCAARRATRNSSPRSPRRRREWEPDRFCWPPDLPIDWNDHEDRHSPRIRRVPGALLVRERVRDSFDLLGAARRAVLGMPPLLHGQAEAGRHRWPGRALPAPRGEGQDQEGLAQMPASEPRYMGGQAVLEGVMMRGATTWAVAVRDRDGAITVDVRDVPG